MFVFLSLSSLSTIKHLQFFTFNLNNQSFFSLTLSIERQFFTFNLNNRSLFSLTFDSEREEGGREGRDSGIIGHYRLTEITRFQVNVNVLPFIIAFISNQSSNGTKFEITFILSRCSSSCCDRKG